MGVWLSKQPRAVSFIGLKKSNSKGDNDAEKAVRALTNEKRHRALKAHSLKKQKAKKWLDPNAYGWPGNWAIVRVPKKAKTRKIFSQAVPSIQENPWEKETGLHEGSFGKSSPIYTDQVYIENFPVFCIHALIFF